MSVKKVPLRMCVGCRQMKPKMELIRVVKTPQGEIIAPAGAKTNGRGAYICMNKECIDKAKKTGALNRALEKTIDADLYEKLKSECENSEK